MEKTVVIHTTKAAASKVRSWFARRSILTRITAGKPTKVEVLVPTNPAISPFDIADRLHKLVPGKIVTIN